MCKKRKNLEELLSLRGLKTLCIISYLLFALGLIFSCNMHLKYPNYNPFLLVVLIFSLFSFSLFVARKTQLKMEKEKKEFQKEELKEIFKTPRLVRYKTNNRTVLENPLQSLLLDLQDMECFESEAHLEGDTIYVIIHANNKYDSIPFTSFKVFKENFEIIK